MQRKTNGAAVFGNNGRVLDAPIGSATQTINAAGTNYVQPVDGHSFLRTQWYHEAVMADCCCSRKHITFNSRDHRVCLRVPECFFFPRQCCFTSRLLSSPNVIRNTKLSAACLIDRRELSFFETKISPKQTNKTPHHPSCRFFYPRLSRSRSTSTKPIYVFTGRLLRRGRGTLR